MTRCAARSCVVHGSRSVGASGPSSFMRSHNLSRSMASKERSVIGSPPPIHHDEYDDDVVTHARRLPWRCYATRRPHGTRVGVSHIPRPITPASPHLLT